MTHTRPWSTTQGTPAGASNLSDLDTNIANNTVDIEERMQLQHHWDNTGASDDGNSGRDDDGMHLPGATSVVETNDDVSGIEGSYKTGSYNGSLACSNDTDVMYVKKGTVGATDGTWTSIANSGYSPSAAAPGTVSVTLPNGIIMKWGTQALTNTTSDDTTVTFATQFPSGCYTVQLTSGKTDETSWDYALSAHTLTATTFKIRCRIGTRHTPAHWFAVGY